MGKCQPDNSCSEEDYNYLFVMSTEAVTKIRQLEWKQRFSSEAGECSLGPWLLQAEEQMETPLPNDFKNR